MVSGREFTKQYIESLHRQMINFNLSLPRLAGQLRAAAADKGAVVFGGGRRQLRSCGAAAGMWLAGLICLVGLVWTGLVSSLPSAGISTNKTVTRIAKCTGAIM